MKPGSSESVYLNPYTGEVLGRLSVENRLMKQIRNLHRGLMLGKTGKILMELAGCWTLVMIGTGIALWWPKARQKWSPARTTVGVVERPCLVARIARGRRCVARAWRIVFLC